MIYHNNTMQSGGLTVELNTKKDVRLEHNLSFEEFNRAFRKYRNIMCKAYPHRKAELEQYEADINEIGKSITMVIAFIPITKCSLLRQRLPLQNTIS
jgi:uncharacterized DUF497 family protein